MRTLKLALVAAAVGIAALTAGCKDTPATPGGPGLDTTPGGDSPPLDHPPIDPSALPVASRGTGRLSIAQLRATIPVLFGNEADGVTPITWHLTDGRAGLDVEGPTLGEPDYIDVTTENLDPSPMYAKFMDDLARDVCTRVITADASKTDAAKKVVMRYAGDTDTVTSNPDAISANIRYLKLRLHGVKLDATDDTDVAPLRTVFDATMKESAGTSAVAAKDVQAGWKTVCIAMVVAPEFHIY